MTARGALICGMEGEINYQKGLNVYDLEISYVEFAFDENIGELLELINKRTGENLITHISHVKKWDGSVNIFVYGSFWLLSGVVYCVALTW
ncbi:hypothetical protein KVG29_05575 [Caldicoprobacter algeriensis]|uniref:hypothetical protein n=1 Tax=Caldicoprobacter algeriensis TaxID=699281 RepID=UPI002079AC2F|nr:hypothetical protein [Caldicoprobacter algeriensis]MCM8900697.1 hypothetical protein [Caldicoprobacter algeriensis]